jgi:hypothetical protein
MQQRSATPEPGGPERPAVGDTTDTTLTEGRTDAAVAEEAVGTADLVRLIETTLPGAFRVIAIAPDDPAVAVTPPASPSRERELFALVTDGRAIALYQRPFGDSSAAPVTGTLTEVPIRGDVERYEPIRLSADPGAPGDVRSADGMMAVVTGENGTETVYLVASGAGQFVFRTPLSSVQRSVLRDLDGDGVRELVQYSRVFEAGGKREVIIDTLRWNGVSFRYDRSLAVVRAINEELERLGERLRDAQPGDLRFSGTLQPEDGAPPAAAIFPVQAVVIPEFSELLVDLGQERWSVAHEIALQGGDGSVQVYRIQIEIEANPYRDRPVTIVGLE